MTQYLAANIVDFGGMRRSSGYADNSHPHVFENHLEMESAGFEPFTEISAILVAPDLKEGAAFVHSEIIHQRALRATTAFLCLVSENEAHRLMKPENARMFSNGLYTSVAERCAGRFGFHSEPREAWATIHGLAPTFRCDMILNAHEPGHNDGLAALLLHLAASEDGRTEYGFVTGSGNQTPGCAAHLVTVMAEISDSLSRCAKDMGW